MTRAAEARAMSSGVMSSARFIDGSQSSYLRPTLEITKRDGYSDPAGAAVVIGAVFALANQGLAAAFGGAGRLISLAMALIALAVGLSSTVPPLLTTVSAGLPTHTASDLLLATLTGQTVSGLLALGGLLLVALGGFALVLVGVVARRRATAAS